MGTASHICTHCFYEGRPVRPPSDHTGEPSETGKALDKAASLLFPGLGFLIRPLAMFMVMPVYAVLWPLKKLLSPKKHCPNCGLPLMVKRTSDAGEIAQRKLELKLGKRFDKPQEQAVVFGREMKLPGDEKKETPPPPPLERLPSLEEMLQEAPEIKPAAVSEPGPRAEEKPKKPVDPDQW